MSESRRSALAVNLSAVLARIDKAVRAAGREAGSVTLVAVTKTRPASDVALLAELGVSDVGESRDQEGGTKRTEIAAPLRWHMVGRVQSNKARSVATWADVVQSVDRLALVEGLSDGAVRAERTIGVCLQASLDGDPARGGAGPDDLAPLADAVAGASGLTLLGLMAVAPVGADPFAAFAKLSAAGDRLRAVHPDAGMLSAGMSADLEAAITAGATHLRIGTALLGDRPPVVG